MEEKGEYILPVRFDNTEIPGLLPTIHYKDAKQYSPEQICDLIIGKLGIKSVSGKHLEEEIVIPKIKRKISDFDKDQFIRESFTTLKDYFKLALNKTESGHDNVKAVFEEVTNNKFLAKIYVDGDMKSICKIWIGSGISSNPSILYYEGNTRLSFDNDNTYNDSASVRDNGEENFFQIMNLGFGIPDKSINVDKATGRDLAVHFWKKFIQNLN